MDKYRININGNLYESSNDYTQAKQLYETVDDTCLSEYQGSQKELVNRENSRVLKQGTIKRRR